MSIVSMEFPVNFFNLLMASGVRQRRQTRRDAVSTFEFYFRSSCSRAFSAPMAHEKTIAQSRDRQGAEPLADARGSVCISIFAAACLKS